MKKMKNILASFMVAVLGTFVLAPVATVGAIDPLDGACKNNAASEICANKDDNGTDLIGKIVDVLLFVVGALSVVMIIVSGILYVSSTGDAGRVSKAKNTLTYSIVGLVVSFLAFAIVNWVRAQL